MKNLKSQQKNQEPKTQQTPQTHATVIAAGREDGCVLSKATFVIGSVWIRLIWDLINLIGLWLYYNELDCNCLELN